MSPSQHSSNGLILFYKKSVPHNKSHIQYDKLSLPYVIIIEMFFSQHLYDLTEKNCKQVGLKPTSLTAGRVP